MTTKTPPKFTVTFEVRKGNSVAIISATVETATELMAVPLAQTKVLGMYPAYRTGYTLSVKSIKAHLPTRRSALPDEGRSARGAWRYL